MAIDAVHRETLGIISAATPVLSLPTSTSSDNTTSSSGISSTNSNPLMNNCQFLAGWGSRTTLKHPPIDSSIKTLVNWAWNYGIEHKAKINAIKLTSLLHIYGTAEGAALYRTEKIWQDALLQNNGNPIISTEDIPELWRLQSVYSRESQNQKDSSRNRASTIDSDDPKLLQLFKYYLDTDTNNIFTETDNAYLASLIVSAIQESNRNHTNMIQQTLKSKAELKLLSPSMLRAIVDIGKHKISSGNHLLQNSVDNIVIEEPVENNNDVLEIDDINSDDGQLFDENVVECVNNVDSDSDDSDSDDCDVDDVDQNNSETDDDFS